MVANQTDKTMCTLKLDKSMHFSSNVHLERKLDTYKMFFITATSQF